MEISHYISSNILYIISISFFGLPNHVLSVHIVMYVLNECFKVSVMVIFMLL
jgi:hypothetical protein